MSDEGRVFVDTNILVYAHDVSAQEKHVRARELLRRLWDEGGGGLSIQVLQEFYVTITRKVARPLAPSTVAEIIGDLAAWRVHSPTAEDIQEAIRLQQRYGLSFWDAMILTSARALGCAMVWSEDLNAGQHSDNVQVVNPLI